MGLPHRTSTLHDLSVNGWSLLQAASSAETTDVLASLGPLVPSRRTGATFDILKPYDSASAPPGSMSAATGTNAQPMHTDAAWEPLPPNYIALQCVDPGETPCQTHVWALDLERLRIERPAMFTAPSWIVSNRGRVPSCFYSPVMEEQGGEIRVRFDPLCMRLVTGAKHGTGEVQKALGRYSRSHSFRWERGSLLVINNWRCLHARGEGADRASSRRLHRWTIGARNGLVA